MKRKNIGAPILDRRKPQKGGIKGWEAERLGSWEEDIGARHRLTAQK
jgi:hypothetical protein